jgi:hypothetical protein
MSTTKTFLKNKLPFFLQFLSLTNLPTVKDGQLMIWSSDRSISKHWESVYKFLLQLLFRYYQPTFGYICHSSYINTQPCTSLNDFKFEKFAESSKQTVPSLATVFTDNHCYILNQFPWICTLSNTKIYVLANVKAAVPNEGRVHLTADWWSYP